MKAKMIGLLLVSMLPGLAAAQKAPADTIPTQLSLAAALARALEKSEEVRVADAQVEGARAQVRSARAAALPQINTQLAYTKTLRSVFQSAGGGFALPDSLRFQPDSTASLAERVRYLEQRVPNAALGTLGGLFSDLPFGNENTWVAGVTVAQPLFTGGRVSSAISMAGAAEDAARAGAEEARADVALQVKQAYYDAVLAARSVEIMETSVELANEHLQQVRLRKEAGRASDLEVLRAEVESENLGPELVQARNASQLATLNLKRLINIPADADVTLTTELAPKTATGVALTAIQLPALAQAEAQLARRALVRQADEVVAMRKEQTDIAKSSYLPNVALTGNLNRQAFPTGNLPAGGDWRDDWSVGVALQWSLFQGGKRAADIDARQADERVARLQRDQAREGVRLEYDRALGELQRAQAQITAVTRTVDQAQRVYDLTELRYREGLATQLDVSNARLALQQARMNQIRSYHEAYSALARAERALGVPAAQSTLP